MKTVINNPDEYYRTHNYPEENPPAYGLYLVTCLFSNGEERVSSELWNGIGWSNGFVNKYCTSWSVIPSSNHVIEPF